MYQLLDDVLFDELILRAKKSARKRAHLNLHPSADSPVQHLCIGLYRGTYVQPHQHTEENKWEQLMILRGRVVLLFFNDSGTVSDRLVLGHNESNRGIKFPPNTWHTVLLLDESAILLEIKEGPYSQETHSKLADWAPEEGSDKAAGFMQWALNARLGDAYI